MPPRKRISKTAALFAEAAKFLESVNAEVPTVDLDAIEDRDYRSTDGLVLFAHYPANFKPGCCAECGALYAVNRNAVGFCSDPCRRENWKKTTGLEWRAVSVHDVWEGNPPNIINSEQLKKLVAIADWVNTNRKVLDTLAETASEQQQRQQAQHDLEDSPLPQALQLSREEFLEEIGWFEESLEVPSNNLPTSPPPEPSHEGLELTEEEAFLFESL